MCRTKMEIENFYRIISWNNNNQDFYDNSKINKKKNIRMDVCLDVNGRR